MKACSFSDASDASDASLPVGLPPQRAGTQSVEVGFSLLQLLTEAQGPLMLRDPPARAGMSTAKAHRYPVSYQRLGLVVQDAGSTRYDLGPAALKPGILCITLARPWRADRKGPQGVFLQPIARLLARKTMQWTARARATTDVHSRGMARDLEFVAV